MVAPRTTVIVNPKSQGGKLGKRWPELADTIGRAFPFDVVHTTAPGDATKLAREALRGGAQRVVAIGGDDALGLAPADCTAGQLHYVSTLNASSDEGSTNFTSYVFVNAINGQDGELDIGDVGGQHGGDRVYITFHQLVLNGQTVSARGVVNLPSFGLAGGNCETGSLTGRFEPLKDGHTWRFGLTDLHADPYCTGAAISGEFGGCFRDTN